MTDLILLKITTPLTEQEDWQRLFSPCLQNNFFSLKEINQNTLSRIGKGIVISRAEAASGIPADSLAFSYGEHGKPFLPVLPDFHFNISHSGNVCAVAFSDKSVGVDVETVRQVNRKVLRRFTEKEQQAVVGSPDPTLAFFRIWTAKEAVLKECGKGLCGGLDSFAVCDRSDTATFVGENIICSVCTNSPEPIKITTLPCEINLEKSDRLC